MLPGKDGITLVRELRQGGSSIPVLMISARSEVESRVRGLESGADYYLTKPFAVQGAGGSHGRHYQKKRRKYCRNI